MNRYTQGFRKFGWMEQCNDGEWVKYEDHFKELIHANTEMSEFCNDRIRVITESRDEYRDEAYQLKKTLAQVEKAWSRTVDIVVLLSLFIIIGISFLFILGKF